LFSDYLEDVGCDAMNYYHTKVVYPEYDGAMEVPNMGVNYYQIKRNFNNIPEKLQIVSETNEY